MKGYVEGEARKENQEEEEEEDVDLTPHELERALKGSYRSFMITGTPKTDIDSYFDQAKTTHQDVNRKPAKGNGVCKDNHDPMGNMEETYNATH